MIYKEKENICFSLKEKKYLMNGMDFLFGAQIRFFFFFFLFWRKMINMKANEILPLLLLLSWNRLVMKEKNYDDDDGEDDAVVAPL